MKFLYLLLPLFLLAQAPVAYKELGEQIDKELPYFNTLSSHSKFSNHLQKFSMYFEEVNDAFSLGYSLDKEISNLGKNENELQRNYLISLRRLQAKRDRLKSLYYDEIQSSIKDNNMSYSLFLLENGSTFLQENKKLLDRFLVYAQEDKVLQEHEKIKAYQKDKKLDEFSYAYNQKMQEEYRAYQEVLKKAEALKLRKLLVSKQKGGVIVYAQESNGDIDFVIENLFEMHVSVSLNIKDVQGYSAKENLPYKLVLKPKEKRQLVGLKNISKKKEVGYFSSHISWVKGAVGSVHNEEFIYALPFRKEHKVSQGFNGNTSHKGTAKYAVDFAMDIGTEVYAARTGKVVEIVQNHDKHGMSTKMSAFANYVIIEHEDKSLGRYFHLQHHGVKVKLAQVVAQGELIALSGNTGRTSGPHLHFVVTKAQEYKDGYRSMSVPIKFNCSEGIIDNPIKGHIYCYAK